jgi:hypothetical protein
MTNEQFRQLVTRFTEKRLSSREVQELLLEISRARMVLRELEHAIDRVCQHNPDFAELDWLRYREHIHEVFRPIQTDVAGK